MMLTSPRRETVLRLGGLTLCAALLAVSAVMAAPFDAGLAAKIDTYLHGKGSPAPSPIEGNGQVFYDAAVKYNVDPRLIVAIAGQESSFGTKWGACSANGFNAWSWFYNGTCANSPFSSYAEGINTVTKFMRRTYFDLRGQTTIDAIQRTYCPTPDCTTWAAGVTSFYTDAAWNGSAGDVTDLTFRSTEVLLDFETLTGPAVFNGIKPPVNLDIATISGGQPLNGATNLPADRSVLYGTAYFCGGCLPTITIDFSQPVSEFSVFVYNGLTTTVTYTVQDDKGAVVTKTLPSNLLGGNTTVFLESKGIRQVVLRGGTNASTWDFFVDNIRYTPG
jgi:hypothetical protein